MKLGVAQMSAVVGNLEASIDRHVRLTRLAARQGARWLLFPELSLTGYSLELTPQDELGRDDQRLLPLQAVADESQIAVTVGAPLASDAGLHIGAITFLPRAARCVHSKRFLHAGEETCFVPGNGGPLLRVDRESVALAICADTAHAEHASDAAARGCTVYAASSFITTRGYSTDTARLRSYARQHRMIVMLANYAGPLAKWQSAGQSAVWNAEGVLLASAPEDADAIVLAERSEQDWRATSFAT